MRVGSATDLPHLTRWHGPSGKGRDHESPEFLDVPQVVLQILDTQRCKSCCGARRGYSTPMRTARPLRRQTLSLRSKLRVTMWLSAEHGSAR